MLVLLHDECLIFVKFFLDNSIILCKHQVQAFASTDERNLSLTIRRSLDLCFVLDFFESCNPGFYSVKIYWLMCRTGGSGDCMTNPWDECKVFA